MAEQDPPYVDTLEWGGRPSVGAPVGPDMTPPVAAGPALAVELPAPAAADEPPEDRRAGPVAIALLAVGFGLALLAEYLPWTSINLRSVTGEDDSDGVSSSNLPDKLEFDLASLNTGHVMAYLSTVILALVAIAVVLVGTGLVRRIATAAALALLAGNALVLVGFKRSLDHIGTRAYGSTLSLPDSAVQIEAGYPLAAAAAAVLAAGVVVAGRGLLAARRSRRRAVDRFDDDADPIDLTVTPLPNGTVR